MSSLDGLMPVLRAAPETAGSSTEAAEMLFINRERNCPGQHDHPHHARLAGASQAHQQVARLLGDARPLQPFGQDRDGQDGDHRRAAKAGEGLLGGQDAAQAQCQRDQQRGEVRTQAVAEKNQDRPGPAR